MFIVKTGLQRPDRHPVLVPIHGQSEALAVDPGKTKWSTLKSAQRIASARSQ